ncbi:hypothetical protein [Actinomadura macra]|uniref:hypothetical protein n=1 Tax=Actinomadura macra TaxID=46164 RepID=UPI0012FB22C6|nr:hypothetical protein [Actinomadura macra]
MSEEIEDEADRFASLVKVGPLQPLKLAFQAGALVPNLPQAFAELVLWPVRVTDEVKELVLLVIELGELLRDEVPPFVVALGLVVDGAVDGSGDALAQVSR